MKKPLLLASAMLSTLTTFGALTTTTVHAESHAMKVCVSWSNFREER